MNYGTHSLRGNKPGGSPYWQLLETNEVNRLPWAKEIENKINLFNAPVEEFLDVFVPGPRPSKKLTKKSLMYAFKTVRFEDKQGEECPTLIRGLRNLVQDFEADAKSAFAEGSRCQVPFPFEAWDQDHHYAVPGIILSLPGNSDANWARAWSGISTVFKVRPEGLEEPVDEDCATIRKKALVTYGLIQVAKSARNLLHTHRLLYAYVVGIYGDKARIYRFDHVAGVVSKAVDLKKDPYPLYDFLWRCCHYEHGGQPASASPQAVTPPPAETTGSTWPSTRSMLEPILAVEQRRTAEPGIFLGMDPTISATSDADCNTVDELLQTSSPPQKTKDERKACQWVSLVTEYNPDGSAKTTKRYIMYRVRFLTPRLSDAYEAETWERWAIKDAWRQRAREQEDVLYDQLSAALRQRKNLDKLVKECKKSGLPCDNSATGDDSGIRSDDRPPSTAVDKESKDEVNDEGALTHAGDLATVSDSPLYELPDVKAGDDLGGREARKLLDINNTGSSSPSEANLDLLALGDADRPPVYHRTESWEAAKFNDRSHMRLVMRTVGGPLSSFRSMKEMMTVIRAAIIGHKLAFIAGPIHRDLRDGNVMIHDGVGLPADKEAWVAYVEKYNDSVGDLQRSECTVDDISTLVAETSGSVEHVESWAERVKIKERTATLFFMAAQVLGTFNFHDVRHDLESAMWLLLCMVLRHTLQVHVKTKKNSDRYALYLEHFSATAAKESYINKMFYLTKPLQWEVKDNKPLTKLIHNLWDLAYEQNPSRGESTPLTYESVATAFNRALALSDWPEDDVALPFTLPGTGNSSASGLPHGGNRSGSGSQGTKRPRQNEGEGKDG
ncbi:hypothetical protein FOMPIDRAFT_1052244 [Fomitopsis schrenkii]|uniref:Fungal-type protein kinase domain-containing protein n=1 Tax=Fomitopsis schrenkii TaxID=2126942 RepID=S8DYT0_FOMSC|nr:hypothetical protein FOMPIDRAFT_1052244 [Fomitopsis schrenkii]